MCPARQPNSPQAPSRTFHFSGAAGDIATQQAAFNHGVAGTIGENATKLTTDVMNAARTRIGAVFDNVGENTTIAADAPFMSGMQDVMTRAGAEIAESEMKPLQASYNDITSKIGPDGTIPGSVYQSLTRDNTPLGRAMDNPDPNIAFFARQMRNVFDDAFQRSAPPEMQADLANARKQWAALKTLEPLAAKATTGDVSPALLMGKSTSRLAMAWPMAAVVILENWRGLASASLKNHRQAGRPKG
jgi:hypothetical protein